MKKAFVGVCLWVSVMLLSVAGCMDKGSLTQKIEGAGFSTPEGAVVAYLEALRDGDLELMMSTFAIESYNQDLEDLLQQTGVYQTWVSPLPNANELVAAMNSELRRAQVSAAIFQQKRNLNIPDDEDLPESFKWPSGTGIRQTIMVNEYSKKEISELVDCIRQHLDSPRLATLKVRGFIPLKAFRQYSADETFQDNMDIRAARSGADDLTSCAAMFELDGEMYLFCADVANYAGKWSIEQLGGSIERYLHVDAESLTLENYGGIVPLTNELFEEYTALLVPAKIAVASAKNNVPQKAEGDGFKTPEDAVRAFIAAYKKADVATMISAVAVESYVENIDFAKYLYYFGYFQPWYPIYVDNEFEYAINLERRRSTVASNIYFSYRCVCFSGLDNLPDASYLAPDGNSLRMTLPVNKSEEDISTFIDWLSGCLNARPLNTIELRGFIPCESLLEDFTDTVKKQEAAEARIYGADTLSGCVAVLEWGGDMFLFAPEIARYGDKYYIFALEGHILRVLDLGYDVMGAILPISNELYDEYAALIE